MTELATVAVVLLIVIAALLALAPAISMALVRSRGRGLPPSLAVRLNEEWSSELAAIPDRATKLAFAIGIRLTRRKAFAGLAGDAMTTPEMTPRRSGFSFFGGWKSIIATPTILLAIVGYAASFWITPLYRSETMIVVVPQRVLPDIVKPTMTEGIEDRLQSLRQQILSRTRLERIIVDFDLYSDIRRAGPMEPVVERMRRDIAITIARGDAFRVSYDSSNPIMAMRVAERLASLFIEESLRDREIRAAGTTQFLEAQADDARRRLLQIGTTLDERRLAGSDNSPELTVMKLEYDAMSAVYKDLLAKREAAKIAANLERRQIGEQFKLLEPARLPGRPFAPNREFMTLVGAIVGLCLGLAMMLAGLGRRPGRPPEAVRVGETTG